MRGDALNGTFVTRSLPDVALKDTGPLPRTGQILLSAARKGTGLTVKCFRSIRPVAILTVIGDAPVKVISLTDTFP